MPDAAAGAGGSQMSVRAASAYLAMSAGSGFVELGAIVFAVSQGIAFVMVLVVGLAYQVGVLCGTLVTTGRIAQQMLFVTVAIVVIAMGLGPWAIVGSVFAFSVGLTGAREVARRGCSIGTLTKRISRVIGFAAASVFGLWTCVVAALVAVGAVTLTPRIDGVREDEARIAQRLPHGVLGLAMMLHQMHYFVYAYGLPIMFFREHGLADVTTALAFAAGWVTYSLAPVVLGRLPTLATVVTGHIGVAVVLIMMAELSNSTTCLLTGWCLSGFGGGTVFALRQLASRWTFQEAGDLDLAENVGHVLGVLLAILVALVLNRTEALLVVGAICALSVAAIVTVGERMNRAQA